MEKRNKQLAVTLVALLALTVLSAFWINRRAFAGADAGIFRVADLTLVDSVALEAPGRSNKLSFDGTRWLLNGEHRADGQMVEVLFATLAQVTPRRPISDNLRDSVTRVLEQRGTKVTLFATGEKKMEFYAGGNEEKNEAWFLSPTEGPFVVAIPGYRVYASGVFELDESGWRDKQVFRFNQRNFKSLSLDFIRDPSSSFVINYEDQEFDIPGITAPDTSRIFDFLDAASLLKAQEIISPGEKKWVDSLMTHPASFIIDVTDLAGRTSRLTIFPPVARERLVAGMMGEEAALFSKSDIVKLAKKKSYFSATR
jgi:hypothetical protein